MPNTRSAFALRRWATAERAARPASLASSARAVVLVAGGSQASARAARPLASGALPVSISGARSFGVLALRETDLCGFFPFAASERFSAQALALGRLQWVEVKLPFFLSVPAPSRVHAGALINQRTQVVFRVS